MQEYLKVITRKLVATLLTAGLVLALPLSAVAQESGGWRKEIADKAQAAQEAGQKGNFQEAIKQLKDAKARGALQPKEEQAINELMIWAATSAKDWNLVAATVEERIKTGRVTGADLVRKYQLLSNAYYSANNLRAAAAATEKLIAARGSANADDLILLGQLQFQLKDYRTAAVTLDQAASAAARAGKPAKTQGQVLEMLNASYFELGNEAKRLETLHKLMVVAPKASIFDQLVNAYNREVNGDSVVMINLYRLGASRGLLSREHYGKYADAALDLASPGEAVTMLEKGLSSGAIKKDDRNTRLLADARDQVAKLKSSLPQQEKEAMAMASGDAEAKLATSHFTLKNYAKSGEAAKRAVQKGRMRRPDDVNMMLGIALIESKRAAEAKNAFRAAATANSKIRGVADLWSSVAT